MKRFLYFVIAILMIMSFTACKGKDDDFLTTSPDTDFTEEETKEETVITPTDELSVLTGLPEVSKGKNRPIGIMVPNDNMTVGNQPHIDEADFYMECETEGAIPRLLVGFSSIERFPEIYGPVRSARAPFVATARSLGMIYIHAGGSRPADAILDTGVLDRINALTDDGSLFWRDQDLKNRIDYVHSLVTSREKIAGRIERNDFSSAAEKPSPFVFGATSKGDITANSLQLKSTPSVTIHFDYDRGTGLYGKNIVRNGSIKPHTSLEGDQIKVKNVLVLYAEKYAEIQDPQNGSIYNFVNGQGDGYLISDGTAKKIKFTRTDDSLSFKNEDGSVVKFTPGKIYMVLADKNLSDTISFS